jgi:hypothetical protein
VKRFKATPAGITVTFTHDEAEVLTDIARQLEALLAGYEDLAGDAALERLLPDGYRDNEEDAAEFRRFTQGELVDEKVAGARTIIESLTVRTVRGEVQLLLSAQEAFAWLRSLNDIRLALAARLGITDENWRPPQNDNDYAIYLWLGQVQYSLLRAVDR